MASYRDSPYHHRTPPKRTHEADAAPPASKRLRTHELAEEEEKPFVWKKKNEQMRKKGMTPSAPTACSLQDELSAARARRAERDAERAAREEEMAREMRERLGGAEMFDKDDVGFMARQYYERQRLRMEDGRGNVVDGAARWIRMDVDVGRLEGDVVSYVGDLGDVEMGVLKEGVEEELDYVVDFEGGDEIGWDRKVRTEFWRCVREIVRGRQGMDGVNEAVVNDVKLLMDGKNVDALRELEKGIEARLGDEAESEFWSAALGLVRVRAAEARLAEIEGMVKPVRKRFEGRRREMREKRKEDEDDMVAREAGKGMQDGEAEFAEEVEVRKGYRWNDKYRPRKPRYFNRVHTGYNWTKYNRTHYDKDNPPPKSVQGYRFNIFYPDLIDRSVTPTFRTKKTDNPDVAIITFSAGAPYEDVAFRIVDRPWERSHRRGYRCCFERGVLMLWFNLQRYRYRR